MAHVALYRTYRPQDFDKVVGQKHIVQTIKNQVKNNLLSHAYVLTGPRGTGKTSIARIVAKAINCTNSKKGNPCSCCTSCLAVTKGNHPDVFELDGASNNGVDEIRDIRDRVKYSPSLAQYKVYIIDEFHMLSTGAFNALLKTLEEPPPHVIFMLATTEIHKIPDTILSRVQRFDLKQIPTLDITLHLKRILEELNVEFENGVPELIATAAAGSLRDALSMLDQAIAYTPDTLKLTDIHDLFGSVDIDALKQIIDAVASSDYAIISRSTRALFAAGKLPAQVTGGLLRMLRDLLRIKHINDIDDTTGLANKLSSQQVFDFIKKLNNLNHEINFATDAELILEVGLIELGLNEAEPEQSVVSSAIPTPDYDLQIKSLKKQVHDLQAEVKKLKSMKSSAVASFDHQQTEMPISMPIYVQGELVQHDAHAAFAIDDPRQGVAADVFTPGMTLLIEDILAHATKQDKLTLQHKVDLANPFAKLDIKEIVMLLKDAEIVAASPIGCILVYEYETTAQKLLIATNRDKAYQVLADMLGKAYGFLSLPKDFWFAQRESFVAQRRQGITPILKQYPQQLDLKAADGLAEDVPFYQEVVDMFGDLVEIVD